MGLADCYNDLTCVGPVPSTSADRCRFCLKDVTADQLYDGLAGVGLTRHQARQIHAAVVRAADCRRPMRASRPNCWDDPPPTAIAEPDAGANKTVSPKDGFAKYLFRGDGLERFEAVRIPLLHRPDDRKYVVCVSSQVGCAMGCALRTGRMGFRRNLAAWEIVNQVIKVQADSPHPVRGVVFMGMGEPLFELRLRDPSGADSLGTLRRGHRPQGHHDLDGRHRAGDPAFHRRAAGLPPGGFAELGRSGPSPPLDARGTIAPDRHVDRSPAGVPRGDGPAGDFGVDHDGRRQYARRGRPDAGRTDARNCRSSSI